MCTIFKVSVKWKGGVKFLNATKLKDDHYGCRRFNYEPYLFEEFGLPTHTIGPYLTHSPLSVIRQATIVFIEGKIERSLKTIEQI